MCGDQINSIQHNEYHGCWCPGSLRHQDISTCDIDYVELVSSWLTWRRISTACVMSIWKNDIKCKYVFLFPLKNFACKGLIFPGIRSTSEATSSGHGAAFGSSGGKHGLIWHLQENLQLHSEFLLSKYNFDDLVQDCSNSIATALELLQFELRHPYYGQSYWSIPAEKFSLCHHPELPLYTI